MTPLLPTIVRESDLQDLTDFIRRWDRLPVVAVVGVAVATVTLGVSWLLTPTGMSELPAGSIVLLAFLLYDFGALMVFGDFFELAFTARLARYDHDLFWPSPADSPEVRKAMQIWNVRSLAFWITVLPGPGAGPGVVGLTGGRAAGRRVHRDRLPCHHRRSPWRPGQRPQDRRA